MRASLGPHHAAGTRPADGALLAVHLPGVLLVVKYLLVSTPGSVLHVSQGANPARHFKLQLLVVNLDVSPSSLVFEIFSGPNPGLGAPVQLTVLNLDISPSRSVLLIDSLGPGLSVPVQLSVLDLDISSARPMFGVGKGPNPRLGRQQVGRGGRSNNDLV